MAMVRLPVRREQQRQVVRTAMLESGGAQPRCVSSNVIVYSGEHTGMYLYHNGVSVTESFYETRLDVGNGHIIDQGSRTVVSFACL